MEFSGRRWVNKEGEYEFCKKCAMMHEARLSEANRQWNEEFKQVGLLKQQADMNNSKSQNYWKQVYKKKLAEKQEEFDKELRRVEATLAADYPLWSK